MPLTLRGRHCSDTHIPTKSDQIYHEWMISTMGPYGGQLFLNPPIFCFRGLLTLLKILKKWTTKMVPFENLKLSPFNPQILNPLLTVGGDFRGLNVVPLELKWKLTNENGTLWDKGDIWPTKMVTFGIKGAGGLRPGEGRNRVFCFWRRGVSATRCFLPAQKILFLAKVIKFWNTENTGNYSIMRTLNAFSRKCIFLEFQNLFSPTFFEVNAWNLKVMF